MTASPDTTRKCSRQPGYIDAVNASAPAILSYGQGLKLYALASGLGAWRCNVQRDHRSTTITLGYFPSMSIKDARAARLNIRLAADPGHAIRMGRKAAIDAEDQTVRAVAARWIGDRLDWTDQYRRTIELRINKHILARIGHMPIAAVTKEQLHGVLKDLLRRSPSIGIAMRQAVTLLFDYATRWEIGGMKHNPMRDIAPDLRLKRREVEHNPHVATIEDARAVLAAIETRARFLSPWTVLSHRLIALTAARKQEALAARWREFDLDKGLWTLPKARTKQARDHVIVLAPQAVELLKAAARIRPDDDLVFPSSRTSGMTGRPGNRTGRMIYPNALNDALRNALRLAGRDPRTITVHGWRGTFATIMNERDYRDHRVVDAMLGHKPRGASAVEADYNHARYLPERWRIATAWADLLLDGAPTAHALLGLPVPDAANVVTLRRIG